MSRPHRRLSADEPARVQREAKRILNGLPIDPDSVRHRKEMAAAMFNWKELRSWRRD